jgi:hypothetical protein
LTGDGDVLAGETAADDVNPISELASVQVLNLTDPNRSELQRRVLHPRQENGRSVGVPLDVTQYSRSWDGKPDTKLESSNPGKE